MNEGKAGQPQQEIRGTYSGSVQSNRNLGGGSGGAGAGGLSVGGYDSSSGTVNLTVPNGGFEVQIADRIGMHNVTDMLHNQLAAAILAGYYANPSLMGPLGWHGGFDAIASAHDQAYKIKQALADIHETTKHLVGEKQYDLSQSESAQRSA
jgi:hypothetical protein